MKHTTRTILASLTLSGALAGLPPTASAHEGPHEAPASLELSNRQERLIKEATKRYRNPEAAIADGYLSSETCVELPGVGGMGYHYVKPPLIDSTVDPTQPEVLVYYRTKSGGKLRLGAVEYFVPDADQDPGTDSDRPYLFDHGFEGPMPGHEPGMPIHFDLHAWIYKDNPAGTLADWNPIVTCPA